MSINNVRAGARRQRAARGWMALFLSVVGPAAAAGGAHAADAKVYPAAMCASSQWSTYVNRATNAGSVIVDVHTPLFCPAIGDSEATSTSGLTVARIRLFESTNPPGPGQIEDTSCTVYSYSSSMVLFDSDSGGAGGSGPRTITLDLPDSGGPQYPHYLIRCTLTGGSMFYEYEVEER
jgi:hypothetical protein